MIDQEGDSWGTLRWLLSLPPIPRSLLVALFTWWWIHFALGWYLEEITTPQQVWWLDIWLGGLGGNGFSAFGATVLTLILTAEVVYMVLTYLGNRRRIMDAEKKAAKKVQEAAKKAEEAAKETAERVHEERQKWLEWYESVRVDLEAGRPPRVAPPVGDDELYKN